MPDAPSTSYQQLFANNRQWVAEQVAEDPEFFEHRYHGLIDKWLRNIKDVYRLYRTELDAIADPTRRNERLVELNVREHVYRLCSTSFVQRAWRAERRLHVHGWAYDIRDGLLRDLEIDPEADFDGHQIYEYTDL